MTYQYENLGDERFQQLAQSVLAASFPNLQCLPVGQPDGGRDAFSRSRLDNTKVFQVKYSRNPSAKSERTALEELIESEAAKVAVLKQRGLDSYYMISNVSGTSHLDTGSIDRVNAFLTKEFGVESFCWWRDDLDARINLLTNLKWSFPEILKGTDILEILIKRDGRDVSERRKRAIQGYIASQYRQDRDIRFKQAELQNRVLDLFVDLPIAIAKSRRSKGGSVHFNLADSAEVITAEIRYRTRRRQKAADMLLSGGVLSAAQRIVIEGAPGQGKSTITQYVCQVHRIKILDNNSDLSRLPENHKRAPLRVPFRVDLRDFATWVGGRDPFSTGGLEARSAASSLEEFLSAQITYLSGGCKFDVDDLITTTKAGPVCIVLDGFDEVADIEIREKAVAEISAATDRLLAHDSRVQVVVTSRPAAFANSPGFDQEDWAHFELQDLTTTETRLYTDKWTNAKSLAEHERNEFVNQVNSKLEQPHMQELARNPMQLTILLALVRARGYSLPDKRTALYDSYMDTFFNREAEKSRTVREHRDLLVNIHRFVAWRLQTSAELGAGPGNIKEAELKTVLRDYLSQEGHDLSLVDKLFTGMIERVVALVSRTLGTYEFEVQPLREYFAARYLYETAPYSPPGKEQKGTMPERFDALARNFYWRNVARFYAGCYSRGELPSLVEGLYELGRSENYKYLSHPRSLSAMLLSDYVFAQHPTSVRRVVENTFTMEALVVLLVVERGEVVLPQACGQSILVEMVYKHLSNAMLLEHRLNMMRLINQNSNLEDRASRWKASRPSCDKGTVRWITDGRRLGVLTTLDVQEREGLREKYPVQFLVQCVILDVPQELRSDPELFEAAVEYVLGQPRAHGFRSFGSESYMPFELFLSALSPYTYRELMEETGGENIRPSLHALNTTRDWPPLDDLAFGDCSTGSKVKSFLEVFREQAEGSDASWRENLAPWRAVVQKGVGEFGCRVAFQLLAVLAAGVKNRKEIGCWCSGTWSSGDLVDRARFARTKIYDFIWWREQIDLVLGQTDEDCVLFLLVLFSYGRLEVILRLSSCLSKVIGRLPCGSWKAVYHGVSTIAVSRETERYKNSGLPESNLDPRFYALLIRRFGYAFAIRLYDNGNLPTDSKDRIVRAVLTEAVVSKCVKEPTYWQEALPLIKKNAELSVHFGALSGAKEIPFEIAEQICAEPAAYPSTLVMSGHRKIAAVVGSQAPKLAEAADRERWFNSE